MKGRCSKAASAKPDPIVFTPCLAEGFRILVPSADFQIILKELTASGIMQFVFPPLELTHVTNRYTHQTLTRLLRLVRVQLPPHRSAEPSIANVLRLMYSDVRGVVRNQQSLLSDSISTLGLQRSAERFHGS